MGSETAIGLSVVGCCRDDSTISQYVHVSAISRAPLQLHLMFGSLRLHARLEHNVPAAPVAYVEFRTRKRQAVVGTSCSEHFAAGQQCRRVKIACGGEAAAGRPSPTRRIVELRACEIAVVKTARDKHL